MLSKLVPVSAQPNGTSATQRAWNGREMETKEGGSASADVDAPKAETTSAEGTDEKVGQSPTDNDSASSSFDVVDPSKQDSGGERGNGGDEETSQKTGGVPAGTNADASVDGVAALEPKGDGIIDRDGGDAKEGGAEGGCYSSVKGEISNDGRDGDFTPAAAVDAGSDTVAGDGDGVEEGAAQDGSQLANEVGGGMEIGTKEGAENEPGKEHAVGESKEVEGVYENEALEGVSTAEGEGKDGDETSSSAENDDHAQSEGDGAENSGEEPEEKASQHTPHIDECSTKDSATAADAPDSDKTEQHPDGSSKEPSRIAVEEKPSDDEGFNMAFDSLGKRDRKKKRKKKQSAKPNSLRISIPSYQPKDPASEVGASTGGEPQSSKENDRFVNGIISEDDALLFLDDAEEEEDPLSFYSNTHEGQDPQYVEFHSSRLKQRLEVQLAKLEKAKSEDKVKIQTYLSARWDERNDALQRQINKVRVDMMAKQTRQRAQLSEKHKRQIETDQRKIEEGEKWLIQKQQLELEQQMSQHQQMNLPNNGMVEWNAIATQLQNKHATQRSQFDQKKQDMMKRSEAELQAHNKILEAHHKKRQNEAETLIKDLMNRCRRQQESLKAKLSRLHEERFAKRKADIQAECTLNVDDDSRAVLPLDSRRVHLDTTRTRSTETATELPVGHKGGVHEGSISHDAVVRQKRRKNLMNNALPIQLAVEIHNEGIFVMTRSNHQESERRASETEDAKLSSDKGNGRSTTFLPWGSRARKVLYSIVVGELPSDDSFAFGNQSLVKCMITDSRTSEESASLERADMLVQIQAARRKSNEEDVEQRYSSTCSAISTLQAESALLMEKEQKIATAHKEAILQFERAKQTLDKFKNQAQHFFNQDGSPSPRVNPDSQQKLITAMHKYKAAYESTRSKEATLRQPLEMARNALTHKSSELQRLQREAVVLEQSLKKAKQGSMPNRGEEEALGSCIENIFTSLIKIAERRRAQVNSNKGNSGISEWESSMSGKSFHQKMLRRRITTLLRPSHDAMVADVKHVAKRATNPSTPTNNDCFDICADDDVRLSPELRSEQLLLLALHPPSANPPLPPVPDQSAPNQRWAEPGWQLILDAPGFGESSSGSPSILPMDTEGQLAQQFLSSCCSSGRQAASLIKPRHLRGLEAPMSYACRASAPAEETDPLGQSKKGASRDSDPLSVTDEELRVRYNFVVRPPAKEEEEAPALAANEGKNDTTDTDRSSKTTKKRRQSKKANADSGKAPAKRRKSQPPKNQTNSTSPARDNNAQSAAPAIPPQMANIAMQTGQYGINQASYQQLLQQQAAQQQQAMQQRAQMGQGVGGAQHLAQMRMQLQQANQNVGQQSAMGQSQSNQNTQRSWMEQQIAIMRQAQQQGRQNNKS